MKFLSVTKPGIIFGNLITVAAGFFLGLRGEFSGLTLSCTLIGISLVMASGCVFNNFFDRDIDALMERTKNRVLVKGLISKPIAILYAILLGLIGIALLLWQVNWLATVIAVIGLFFYAIVYTVYGKRYSRLGITLGAIAGATPPLVGYCAASQALDLGAVLMFAMLFFWQMPHFHAIGIFRLKDYQAAAIPILATRKSKQTVKLSMLIHTLLFSITTLLFSMMGYTGIIYAIFALVSSIIWIIYNIRGFTALDDRRWARQMFTLSIIILTTLSVVMMLNPLLVNLY